MTVQTALAYISSKPDVQAVGTLKAKALRQDGRSLVCLDQSKQAEMRSESWHAWRVTDLHLASEKMQFQNRSTRWHHDTLHSHP